jgi:hypothetical protein
MEVWISFDSGTVALSMACMNEGPSETPNNLNRPTPESECVGGGWSRENNRLVLGFVV